MSLPHAPGGSSPDHDPRHLLRARLARTAGAHVATLGLFLYCVSENDGAVLTLGVVILPVLSTFAFLSSLSLSPDPEKGGEWWGTIGAASARTKKWVVFGLVVLWLVLLSSGKRDVTPVVLGYVIAAVVVGLLGFESPATYRSRKGLPPLPTRPSTPRTREERHLRSRIIRAAIFHTAVLLFLAFAGPHCDDVLQALIESVVLAPLALAALASSLSLSPDPGRVRSWWNPQPRGTWWVRALAYVGFFLATASTLLIARHNTMVVCVVYALAAGTLSYHWYESTEQYRTRVTPSASSARVPLDVERIADVIARNTAAGIPPEATARSLAPIMRPDEPPAPVSSPTPLTPDDFLEPPGESDE